MPDKTPRLSSLQNDQVKNLVRLRTRRERDRQQLALIEESLVIRRALAAGYPLSAVYYCPAELTAEQQKLRDELDNRASGAPSPRLVEVSPPVMAKISYRSSVDGMLVVAPQVHRGLKDLDLSRGSAPLVVVLEGVEKPGNLGAVLRIADGAGADAVIVCGQGTDLFNPNVLRASRGACFAVPTVACEPDTLLAFLAEHGIQTLATSPAADTTWDQTDLTGPTAVLLGTEHDGLSEKFMSQARQLVRIPMQGTGDSLNVATATAIMLYEAVRQRQLTNGRQRTIQ